MIEMVRKRHEGEGWCVFEELANGTGYRVKGWADAAALGIWPSRGYELHGFEFKASREDLKRELRDPQKADNVGRYCHYWWLCLTKAELMDGVVVPDVWGVLVPRNGVLRVVRKAPKIAKPKPFDPAFVAAMIRNVTKTWVPRSKHQELKETAHQAEVSRAARDDASQRDADVLELTELRKRVADFEAAAGIRIDRYQSGRIGEAVRLALDARNSIGRSAIEASIRSIGHTSDHHERIAATARQAIAALRTICEPEQLSLLGDDPPAPRTRT